MAFDIMKEAKYVAECGYLNAKSFLAYRVQAGIWLIWSMFTTIISFLTISVIYDVSSGIAGWSYYQMLVLAATSAMMSAIVLYFISPWPVVRRMVNGSIDAYLARPYSRFVTILTVSLQSNNVSGVISGFALLMFALPHVQFTALSMAAYFGLFALGTVAVISFAMAITVLSYHLLKSANFASRIIGLAGPIGNYPLTVFGGFGQLLFSLLIPFGLAYYYPARALFGVLSIGAYAEMAGVAIFVIVASYAIFDRYIKRYTSGGG